MDVAVWRCDRCGERIESEYVVDPNFGERVAEHIRDHRTVRGPSKDVADALRDLTAALDKSAFDRLLPGVEVKFYQGKDGTWHADVLLDPEIYACRDDLPSMGNRPLVDQSTGQRWYDLRQGLQEFSLVTPPPGRARRMVHYTPNEARGLLDQKVAELLVKIAASRLVGQMQEAVQNMDHRGHHEWSDRQNKRRQGWAKDGLPERRS